MKIAINHTRYARSGGIERHIAALVDRLLADGHEVHYFARRWEPREHPRLHFRRVPAIPLGEGIKVLSFAYASAYLISRERFDVVHGFSRTFLQDVYTDGSGCFEDYLEYLRTAPLWRRIATFRPLLAFASRHIERRRFRSARLLKVLAMSRRTRDQILRRHSFPAERVEVAHSGVDVEAFHPRRRAAEGLPLRARLGTPEEATVLLFVGNDYRRKGLETALRALSILGRADLELWVVGKDKRAALYEALARQLRVGARFLGPQADPAACFAAAQVFVFPSLYDAFGNAALEALAAGLPSIVSSRAGASELIDDGSDGLVLQDPTSPGELAAKLGEVLDPGRREAMGRLARAKAEAYRLERHLAGVNAAYAQVLGVQPAGIGRAAGAG
ncbi:MAG: glycosyltransferase family 4 protein, partial [Planctomycetes bacterium]|nr:glycosyltransferase family 4 protein [Planctomycetota bacterium]